MNRFLKLCELNSLLPLTLTLARRAALLRYMARQGSAVDAVVVAVAEPGRVMLTGDPTNLESLAAYAISVRIRRLL